MIGTHKTTSSYGYVDQEYHTEDSIKSDSEQERLDVAGEREHSKAAGQTSKPPLLPAELLNPLPSPAHSLRHVAGVPWDELTRNDKRAERNRSRRAKKLEWERLREEAKKNGALEVGRLARLKRGGAVGSGKVESGRVEKKAKPQVSGKQRILQQRKVMVEEAQRDLLQPSKKAKTEPSR